MKYNFDEVIDRSNNRSSKYDERLKKFGTEDVIPLWVADMDFRVAPPILRSMNNIIEHGILGYSVPEDEYYNSIIDWNAKRKNCRIEKDWIIFANGVVPALNYMIQTFTKEGDSILIQTPVYNPFRVSTENNGRKIVESQLIDDNGYYTVDYEDFERKIVENKIKMFILCNPHNPVGRVWKKDELEKIGNLCKKYNVRILADEIWRDLIMPGHKHTPMGSISKEIEDITITLFSPTKSFNLAGLQASFATFPRAEERKEFDDILGRMDVKRNNPFSLVAFEAAYNKCEDWLEELIAHLDGNMQYVVDFINERIPEIKTVKPEGTYLMWLDFNGIGIPQDKIQEFLINEAKVAMNDGGTFGENGKGFARMNVACPRYMVEEAMEKIEKAVKNIK